MNFYDLLEVLDNKLQLEVTVDFLEGENVYNGAVEDFRENRFISP